MQHLYFLVRRNEKFVGFRMLKCKLESSQEAMRRASSVPLLLCHGRGISPIIRRATGVEFYTDISTFLKSIF